MSLTEKEVEQAAKVVEDLNRSFKEKGVAEAFTLVEKEVDGKICHFFEFSMPKFGIKTLTLINLHKEESK